MASHIAYTGLQGLKTYRSGSLTGALGLLMVMGGTQVHAQVATEQTSTTTTGPEAANGESPRGSTTFFARSNRVGVLNSPTDVERNMEAIRADRDARLSTPGGGRRGAGGQLDDLVPHSPIPIALRLGLALSPRTRFVGGVDVTIPRINFGPGFSTRVDFDAIVSANFGGITTLFPLTFDELYGRSIAGRRIYIGAGVGPYFGEVTRFGGKLVLGADLTSRFGLETNLHFAGSGEAIWTVQGRVRF